MRILALLFLFLPLVISAQESEAEGFTADRPGATTGVEVLPKGRLQWETGFGWERSRISGEAATTIWTLNTSLLRFGISESAELCFQAERLLMTYGGYREGGFANVAIGTKMKLFEGWKAVPVVSMQANVLVPGGKDATFLPEVWGGQLGLLFQNQLTPWLSLGYEGDLLWYDDSRPMAFYGVSLGFQLTDRLLLCAEEYNEYTRDGTSSWIDIGIGWQVARRVQLDIGSDFSLNHFGKYHSLMIGMAWQITK